MANADTTEQAQQRESEQPKRQYQGIEKRRRVIDKAEGQEGQSTQAAPVSLESGNREIRFVKLIDVFEQTVDAATPVRHQDDDPLIHSYSRTRETRVDATDR